MHYTEVPIITTSEMLSEWYVLLDTITLALLSSKYSMMQSGNGDGNKWKRPMFQDMMDTNRH